MSIPAFSVFSAVSELFVTAGVLYVVWRNTKGRRFPGGLFLAIVLFEALVNVLYMANRAAQASTGADPVPTGLKIGFAAHGLLSLLAYVAFVILGVFAWQEQRLSRWFFRDHPRLTTIFVTVWLVSIASGETIFVLRYL